MRSQTMLSLTTPPSESSDPLLTLYSFRTSPNGQKITILLELLELDYHYHSIDIYSNEHKQDWFLQLTPNGRIPVLVDSSCSRKNPVIIFETGAIISYLAEKYDYKSKFSFSPQRDQTSLYWDQVNWLMFQISDHSPFQGQLSIFETILKQLKGQTMKKAEQLDQFEFAKDWYTRETRRIFTIYDNRLKENKGWLVGDGLNVADISAYPWIKRAQGSNVFDLEKEFTEISKWIDRLEMYDRVRKGMSLT